MINTKIPELKILTLIEKKEIERKLFDQFGIKSVPGLIIKRGAERLFLFQGELSPKQIKEMEYNVPIERIGVYFAKHAHDQIRLSIEGVYLLKDQITKNIFELNDEQAQTWMQGSELNVATNKKTFMVMKYKNYFLGCGKASLEKISNFIPKSRRLKNKNIV